MKTSHLVPVLAVVALSAVGCLAPGLGDEGVGSAVEADESTNSLTANSLTANSLTANSLTANSLTANSLTANALTDPASRDVLTYIVSCALPAGVHIDLTIQGVVYGYDGQLGLAPAWNKGNGSCDNNCVAAVSSCVLARLNYLGQRVPISVRGAGLKTTPTELADYPNVDGTYYGNIFSSPQQRYACLPPGVTELTRVCGPSLSGCAVTSQGDCAQVCDKVAPDGSYHTCHAGSASYNRPITVFLQ